MQEQRSDEKGAGETADGRNAASVLICVCEIGAVRWRTCSSLSRRQFRPDSTMFTLDNNSTSSVSSAMLVGTGTAAAVANAKTSAITLALVHRIQVVNHAGIICPNSPFDCLYSRRPRLRSTILMELTSVCSSAGLACSEPVARGTAVLAAG